MSVEQPQPGRRSSDPGVTPLPDAIALAFAPMHKRAFGIAVGTASGLFVFLITVFHLLVEPEPGLNLWLLRQYFYGYQVTWRGAFIGAFWGFFSGFIAGWFVAFSRNLVIAVSLFLSRTRAELRATRDFLDHI